MDFPKKISNSEVFTKIYEKCEWGDGISAPKSGIGSIPSVAAPYSQFVKSTISKYAIKTVVDFGHGDWKMWEQYKFENVSYAGFDVAQGLSAALQKQHGNERRKFQEIDASETSLQSADLLICKDVLQHLPIDQIFIFLESMKNYKYVVICNDITKMLPSDYLKNMRYLIQARTRLKLLLKLKNPFFSVRIGNNQDIESGAWRTLDFERAPFRRKLTHSRIISTFTYSGFTANRVTKKVYFLINEFNLRDQYHRKEKLRDFLIRQ